MKVSRRVLLGGAIAAGLNGCAARGPWTKPGSTAPSLAIIDTHQHLWDLKQFRLPWLDNAGPRLNRNYTLADYEKAIAGLNVVKSVYEEVAVTAAQRDAEADYATDLCRSKRGPTVAAIIGGDVAVDGFERYIRRFANNPYIKGVRCSYPRGAYENPAFVRGVRLLGELKMSFDLLMSADLLAESTRLVDACSDTRFVLDHCGNPSVKWYASTPIANDSTRAARTKWEDGVSKLAERENVVCKISGVAESGDDGQVTAAVVAPVVNYCLDRFGEDRVMFASNWPVCLKTISLANWVTVLKEIIAPRPERLERKLFYGNAAAFFGL